MQDTLLDVKDLSTFSGRNREYMHTQKKNRIHICKTNTFFVSLRI